MIPEEWKTRSDLVQELSDLRRRVAEFEKTYSRTHKDELLSDGRPSRANLRATKLLTRTEVKVLSFILDGKSNKEIANTMHRSVRTIEVHRSHIMHKFDVDNLVDLVKRAAEMGLINLP